MHFQVSNLDHINVSFWFYATIILFLVVIVLIYYMTRKRYLVRIEDVQGRLELLKTYRTRLKNLDVMINVEIEGEHATDQSTRSAKEAEREKEKTRFFALIAHDLRSPTSSLIAAADLLMEGFSSMSDRKKLILINSIFSSSNQLLNLIDNLLNWSTSRSKGFVPEPELFDLSEVQDEIVSLLMLTSEKKKVLVSAQIPQGTMVYADRKMCSTIIRNLLNNAIKFSEFLDEINITMISDKNQLNRNIDLNRYAVICLKDSGIGIPDEDQQVLFEQNNKITRVGTSGEKGSGLGLAICKDFIDLSGGEIWFDSKEGEGSSFYFTLPKSMK